MNPVKNTLKASYSPVKPDHSPSNVHSSTSATFPDTEKFDWDNKWLKGEEYAHILNNLDLYCKTFSLHKLPSKTHPPSIYSEPQNGMIYFVEGNSVGSDFGFPRVDTKKHYRWKKMNFTTDLPKKRPYVTYIVASAVKCERFFPNSKDEGPLYRMHAVILNKERMHTQKYRSKASSHSTHGSELDENSQSLSSVSSDSTEAEKLDDLAEGRQATSKSTKNYILCHIRKIDSNYKTSRSSYGKKGAKGEEEEEEQEDEEEEEDKTMYDDTPKKKLFTSSGAVIPVVKEKDPVMLNIEETRPKIQTLKIVSSDFLDQIKSKSKSESGSPLEKSITRPAVALNQGFTKTGFLGLGSRKSAFNSFQGSSNSPKFPEMISPPGPQLMKAEEVTKIIIPEMKREVHHHRPLFQDFRLNITSNFDYLQLFTTLLNANKI